MLRFRPKTIFNPRQNIIEVKQLATNCQDPYRAIVEQQEWQGALENGELSYFRFSLAVARESEYIQNYPQAVAMVKERLGPFLTISGCSHGDFMVHLTSEASAPTAHLWDHIFGIGLQFLFPGVGYVINLQELDGREHYIFYQIHVVLRWRSHDTDQIAVVAHVQNIGFFITRFFAAILADEPEWYPINEKFAQLRHQEEPPPTQTMGVPRKRGTRRRRFRRYLHFTK